MKKFIIIIPILMACELITGQLKQTGTIKLINGNKKEINAPYTIIDLEDFKVHFTKNDFESIAKTASDKAMSYCKYELTYEPIELMISSNNDTAEITFTFSAQNAYGVPGKNTGYFSFKKTQLIRELVID